MTEPKRQRKARQLFCDPDGVKLTMGAIKKYWRDILVDHLGNRPDGNDMVTTVDLDNPLGEYTLQPGDTSPICAKCGLNRCAGRNKYMAYQGSETPDVTIILDAVSKKEDVLGQIGSEGPSAFIRDIIEDHGFDVDKIRWAPMTICPPENPRDVNFKTKANWCRSFLVQDLMEHPPKLIIPIGSVALGMLSHKSNAQDWGGKLLTYRGWPDDWLSKPEFMLPRVSPLHKDEVEIGHPLFGKAPDGVRIPMIPLQAPRIVWMTQNKHLIACWKNQLKWALDMADKRMPAPDYDKPWWSVTTDVGEIEDAMAEIAANPQIVTFDVETNGLKAWADGAKLVIMMFRWEDAQGNPKAIGFPWDYPESPLLKHVPYLSPKILKAMYASELCGHNISFDIGWAVANIPGADSDRMNEAMAFDTWHMAYVRRQGKGTLGLEMMAYEYCKDLAGYEEDMTMLIDLLEDDLNPGARKGGHYANCPPDKWESHLKPYIMGDVEVCHQARIKIQDDLETSRQYKIPLAHTERRGKFRWFTPPKRDWVYSEVVAPAAAMLSKMMCRGLHVDVEELDRQEDLFPKKIRETINALRTSHPRIIDWCAQMEATDPDWEFDLEKKEKVLKPILFEVLGLPVHRLTAAGKKKYGDKPEDIESLSPALRFKFAATDKFSLNKLAVDHEEIRPLLEYRKTHKQYGTYVRSMRNLFTPGLDKSERTKDQHLARDGFVHATFKLTGTRGGRLSCVAGSTLVQTDSGPVAIKDLRFSNKQQVSTTTHAGRAKKIIRKIFVGYRRTVRITAGVQSIECTPDHRLWDGCQWVAAGERRVGDLVCIAPVAAGSAKAEGSLIGDHRRGHICTVVLGPETERQSTAGVGVVTEANSWNTRRIQGEVQGRAESDYISAFEEEHGWEQTRSERSWDDITEETVARVAGEWVAALRDCEEVWGVRLSGRPEHPAPRLGDDRRVAAPDTVSRSRIFRDQQAVSWDSGGRAVISNGQESVCVEVIPGVFEVVWDGAVPKGLHGGTLASRMRAGSCVKAGEFFVESWRVPHRERDGEPRDKIRQTGLEETVYFRLYRGVSTERGSGRGISRRGEGPEERPERGVSCVADTGEAGRTGHIGAGQFDTARVDKIEDAGVQPVWDLEVEEDHSYCAGGFVNHNCADPNLQQLPRDGLIKRLYNSRFGERGILYQADLSQIELRLIAAACGDSAMVQAYLDNIDLHSLTQSKITDRTYEECCKEHVEWLQKQGREDEAKKIELERKIAKTVNFLTGYGGGAFGLQTSLAQQGIYKQLEECEGVLESFFDGYPSLRKYLSHYKSFVQEHGVAVSILGRVRIFEEVFGDDNEAKNKALRAGCNHLIQSTASDMMLLCLTAIENIMRAEGLESQLVSTVHDSLLIDAVREEMPIIHEISIEVLDNMPTIMREMFGPSYDTSWMIVPISGDAEIGANYLDMLKVPSYGTIDWDEYYTKIDASNG